MNKIFIVPTNTCFGIGCFIDDIDSYKKIYEIKGRSFDKPCAIFVDSYETLENISNLTREQIDFLKKYEKPWTILIDKENIKDNNILSNIERLPNSHKYDKISFRISHNFMHWSLIKENGYFFLTSANKSGDREIKSSKKVREYFKNEMNKYGIRVYAHPDFSIDSNYDFSDIFEFKNNTLELTYLRKN